MRQRTKNNFSTFFLVLILLVLGIGYAYLNTTLSINGTSNIDRSVWDVYFDNIQVTDGSVTGSQVIDEAEVVDDTTVEFHINLKKPGDFYEFTVDAKNDGTIDAMIETVEKKLNGVVVTTLPVYLNYSVTYEDGIEILNNHILAAESLETYKVRIEYRTDIDPDDLPSSAQSLSLSFGVEYVQANGNAISRFPDPVSFSTDHWLTIINAVKNNNTSVYNVGDTRSIDLGDLGIHTLRIANKSTPSSCLSSNFGQTSCGFVLEFADVVTIGSIQSYDSFLDYENSRVNTFLNNELFNNMPDALKNNIINTKVLYNYGSGSCSGNFLTKIYLLSSKETHNYNSYEACSSNLRQLDYYSSLNVDENNYSGAIKKYNGVNSSIWTRTSRITYENNYIYIGSDGSLHYYDINGQIRYSSPSAYDGISPAFRLG